MGKCRGARVSTRVAAAEHGQGRRARGAPTRNSGEAQISAQGRAHGGADTRDGSGTWASAEVARAWRADNGQCAVW